jgi:aromatic ring-cleaving dioxygenase
MSYSNVVKSTAQSNASRPSSHNTSPHPQKKMSELGPMDPVMVGQNANASVRNVRFERVTQTMRLSEALPFGDRIIIQLGEVLKVRMGDNKHAFEYSLMSVAHELLQVRPNEKNDGVDIVIFRNHSFNLNTFHLHVYYDMTIKFSPALKSDQPSTSRGHKLAERAIEKKKEGEIRSILFEGMTIQELYDPEAIANITGSPVQKPKEIE